MDDEVIITKRRDIKVKTLDEITQEGKNGLQKLRW